MSLPFKNDYPNDWKWIANTVKSLAQWKCIRCGHDHDPESGHCLTVHHMDGNKSNNWWWNLLALCQRCHLHIQAKLDPNVPWMFGHSEWIKPYLAGFFAHRAGLCSTRDYIEKDVEHFLELGAKT